MRSVPLVHLVSVSIKTKSMAINYYQLQTMIICDQVTTLYLGVFLKEILLDIYQRLFQQYGPQYWWPGNGPFEIALGAILTQGTSWSNAEKALGNIKDEGLLNPKALKDIPEEYLASLIKPSVYFNTKARKIKALCDYLGSYYEGHIGGLLNKNEKELRLELLSIYGIGEETADDIILYAAKKPVFVIDSYTRRILQRLHICPSSDVYASYQALFMKHLPLDRELYGEYHALLDVHGSKICRKTAPVCMGCSLMDICPTGSRVTS